MSFYTDGLLAINFGFLLGHRSRAELTRLADIIRRIPGARRSVEGIEDRDFRTRRGMRPDAIRAALPDRELIVIPEDATIAGADRDGVAPIDRDPSSPGVAALVALADRLAGAAVPA